MFPACPTSQPGPHQAVLNASLSSSSLMTAFLSSRGLPFQVMALYPIATPPEDDAAVNQACILQFEVLFGVRSTALQTTAHLNWDTGETCRSDGAMYKEILHVRLHSFWPWSCMGISAFLASWWWWHVCPAPLQCSSKFPLMHVVLQCLGQQPSHPLQSVQLR